MMSAVTKKMHVHFPDEVATLASHESRIDEVSILDKSNVLNYTRQQLLLLRDCSSAMEPPIFFDEMDDEGEGKRREKINFLIRPAGKGTGGDKNGHETDENLNSLLSGMAPKRTRESTDMQREAKERAAFDALMASARASNQSESADTLLWRRHSETEQRGGGSSNNSFWDTRYMTSDMRGSDQHRQQFGREFAWNKNRNNGRSYGRNFGGEYRQREAEPEWMTGGPTSQNDVIELTGFQDGCDKPKKDAGNGRGTPPVNSTPTKHDAMNRQMHGGHKQSDDNFNFEDFLKFDLSNGHGSRDAAKGESRFTRWFRKDSPSKGNKVSTGEMNEAGFTSADQFFELMQKSKKIPSNLASMSSRFRSVEELEADMYAPTRGGNAGGRSAQNLAAMRLMNQLNMSKNAAALQQQLNQPSHQQNQHHHQLQDVANKNAYEMFQMQLAHEQILRRPDAQQILQRLARNEISMWHVLQLLGNPITSYDRDTLMAVINYCNGNNRVLDTIKQQDTRSGMRNHQVHGMGASAKSFFQRPITPQELQAHTQAIMQNALLKRQLEQFCMMQQQQQQQQQQQHQQHMAGDGHSMHHNGMRQFGDMQRMQQQNFFKKGIGRKSSFQWQGNNQGHSQMNKPGVGRKPIQQPVAFQLSPVVQKKWSTPTVDAGEANATAAATNEAGSAEAAAAVTVADANSTAATAGSSSSVNANETAGSGFDQTKELSQTSTEVEK